jgi:hypothetical protein
MSLFKKFFMLAVALLLLAGFYGCKKEGPAEKAGKKIDKAMDDAKKTFDDATK